MKRKLQKIVKRKHGNGFKERSIKNPVKMAAQMER